LLDILRRILIGCVGPSYVDRDMLVGSIYLLFWNSFLATKAT